MLASAPKESMAKIDQRDALEVLTRARLIELAQGFELDVSSRSNKDELIDVLARSKRASYEAILGALGRDELKEICRSAGVSDKGKQKAELVERILGREAAAAEVDAEEVADEEKPRRRGKGKGKAGREDEVAERGGRAQRAGVGEQLVMELPADRLLTVAELERYLWSAADILRGSIDSSDYKNYIFGLLFLKRLSDRFEEEAEKLIADGEDPEVAWEDPDEHQFFVPPGARWERIKKVGTNVGEALNKACSALEEANGEALQGVLAGIDFNDPNRLGDTKNRDQVLGRLVQHFGKLRLRNADLSEPDMLGRAYEYLIEKFADDAGKKGGEFYTPAMVVRLIVELLDPREGMRICDPTCGSGGMLVQCAKHVERKGGNPQNLTLHGQEKNLGTWAICKMNMLLHGRASARIEKGDTIRDPKLLEGGELVMYDRVIANPPFSLDEWGFEVAQHDRFGRFRFGSPPKSKGDLAFVQHMVATVKDGGKVGVVMPHGVLFRGASEGKIREAMLREDLFEAVVGLPANLFYGTGIPAAVLVLARGKAKERRGKVLFVDASREFREGSNQNYLREEDVGRIGKAVAGFADVEKYARVVGIEEIEKNDWNLNISRYVDTSEAEERVDLGAAIAKLRQLEGERAEAEARMNGFLKELGYADA
jgi:type I restriction enzyme M protein